jgi:hypothetical protein
MQPALLGTRLETLHGQEVEVKVYGPGQAHQCDENSLIRPCPFCQRLSKYDPDRRGIRLKDIERRWPVALGITEGYHEPISGSMEYIPPPCGFKPPKPVPARDEAIVADNLLAYANHLAHMRACKAQDDRKKIKVNPEELLRRRKQREYAARCRKKRRAEEKVRDDYWENRREERRVHYEAAKIPCQANQCEMGDWIQLDWRQFHELMGRKATTLETRAVRGCAHCPRIESKLAPHFGAL